MAQPIMFLRKDPAALYVCLAHDKPVIGIAKSIYHEFGDGEPCGGYVFKQVDTRYSRPYVLSHPADLYVCLAHDKPVIGIAKAIYHESGDGEPCDGYAFKQGDIRYSRQYVLSHLQAIPPRRL